MNKPTVLHTVLLCLSLVVVSCKETKTDAKHEHHEQAVEKADMALNDVYQCPMDCEDGKTYDKEGLCPVCKMDYKKLKRMVKRVKPITQVMIIPIPKADLKYLRTEALRFGFFICLAVLVSSCRQERQLTAQDIVERSIEAHGGIEQWRSVNSLSFDKTTILFTKDGTVEKEIEQHQQFNLKPELTGSIHDLKLPGVHGFEYDGKEIRRISNDSLWTVKDSTKVPKLKNSFMAANYVVCQPFKLLDDGVILTYKGMDEMDDSTVHVIDVGYKNDTEDSDRWTYYFETNSFKLLANRVKHNSNVSIIKNLEFDHTSGILFNAHRKSFTLKDNGEVDFLRAEYFYTNFKVEYSIK